MNALRQRIPFKFAEETEESQILDEQEQEQVVEDLRSAHQLSTIHHYKFLQGCLGFMILCHVWFLINSRNVTPAHVLLPNARTPSAPLIPFAAGFTLSNVLLLLNAALHLPKDLPFPRVLSSLIARTTRHLPPAGQEVATRYVPLPMPWIMGALSAPALVSVLTLRDAHQVLWWSSPLVVVGLFWLVVSWIREGETEIDKLDELKYDAKGA